MLPLRGAGLGAPPGADMAIGSMRISVDVYSGYWLRQAMDTEREGAKERE